MAIVRVSCEAVLDRTHHLWFVFSVLEASWLPWHAPVLLSEFVPSMNIVALSAHPLPLLTRQPVPPWGPLWVVARCALLDSTLHLALERHQLLDVLLHRPFLVAHRGHAVAHHCPSRRQEVAAASQTL